ncbi:MAG: FAD-binding protein [Phycisphaerae bacterium]|nr:FAD-binding protein [Phycisphaerae bacterium]
MSAATDTSLHDELRAILGDDGVITDAAELLPYECDGLTVARVQPSAVVFPKDTRQTAEVLEVLSRHGVPFAPRGAGTSLSAGTLALRGAVQISVSRMNRILEIDLRNRQIRVQAGVVNQHVTNAVAKDGYFFAPDPASQPACTIGGNIAYNSGGPHTLKYGVTVNHVLGVTLVTPDGEIVEAGGPAEDPIGYDLTGVICGSEGTFGVITEAILRLQPAPEAHRTMLAAFETTDDAIDCVSDMIGEGIVPVALEFMDQMIVRTVEDAYHFGLPREAGAVLIIELEALEAGLDRQADRVVEMCDKHRAMDVRRARTPEERMQLWMCRKRAFGALGRLTPSYVTQDGVVPRTRLPEMLRYVADVAREFGIRIANVFHAGDGNIHPVLMYDERDPRQIPRVLAASAKILTRAMELGGSPTGEHGIGLEKIGLLAKMYGPDDLAAMRRLKAAFDPDERANPCKVFGGDGLPDVFREAGAASSKTPAPMGSVPDDEHDLRR